jgi:cobalamin biosynthesis Mg chelatase CobN
MQANPVFKPANRSSASPQSGYKTSSVPVTVYRELAAELQSTQAKLSFFQLQNDQLTRQNQMLLQEFEAIAQSTERVQAILAQSNLPQSRLSEVLAGIRSSSQTSTQTSTQIKSTQTQAPAPNSRSQEYLPQPNPRKVVAQQDNGSVIQEAIARARQIATESSLNLEIEKDQISSQPLYFDGIYANLDESPAPIAAIPNKKVLPKLEIREEISSRPLRKESIENSKESSGLSGWLLVLTVMAIILTSFGAGYLLMRPFVK